VTLEPVDGGCPFTVATYHMPCAFYDPPLMSLHAAWCAEHALAVAGNAPLVLCGDFNLKPPDPGYELLTTGVLSKEADWPAYPEVPDAPWRIGQNKPLVSAYAQIQGKEPQYTNWAHEPGKDEFIDCLDYLLSSPELTPVSVIELPKRADADGPYPSVTEPSDHLLIGATYTLPSSL
jgi:endonuclease/exonuclease/phosphatase family metal-dependent hydrolase